MVVLQILIALFFAVFLCYQIYALVRDIIAKRKKKPSSDNKDEQK